MNRFSVRVAAPLVLGLVAVAVIAGCATPRADSPAAGGGDPLPATPIPPDGDVVAQGTVIDLDGDVELCLGPIAESYPPQCAGIPLEGWSWEGTSGGETSGGATWGAYAVQGTYDGETFTVTRPAIPLALYDPVAFPDPTGGARGATDEATLLDIQEGLPDWLGSDGSVYFASFPENGYLWVDVIWDDGTYQDAADAEYGEGVVVIRSAIREVEG